MLSGNPYNNPSPPQRNPMDLDEEEARNPHGVKRQRGGFVAGGYNYEAGFVPVPVSVDYPVENPNNHHAASSSTSQARIQGNPSDSNGNSKEKGRKLSCKECRSSRQVVISALVGQVADLGQCDRVFPCQSCVKRGCGSLCPEGALTSGRGSRFILANTEQLHEKITLLTDRVRELEDALATVQAKVSSEPHPLLKPDLLRIKTSEDLYGTSQPPQQPPLSGPPLIVSQPPYRPIGSVSPPNSEKTLPSGASSTTSTRFQTGPPEVPKDILQLSTTFPFPWTVDLRIRQSIREALPPQEEALAICEQAQKHALWQYQLDASDTFMKNLAHHVYTSAIEDLRPRRLALLLMVLSVGSVVDLRKQVGNPYGEAYHHLARAALCEIPLMEEPDFDVLHTLFYMIWWYLNFSDNRKAVGYAWNLMGFVAKLAQGLGLHRESPRLRGLPEEDERRRAIFWELLNIDARMSLSLGRPPSICLAHVDIRSPQFSSSSSYVPRREVIYHEWKHDFFRNCLTPVLEAMVNVEPKSYAKILELDSSVRDFEIPDLLLDHKHQPYDDPSFLSMQRGMVASSREIVLLQLHRRFFTEAMNSPDDLDINHRYAPSVLATFLAASNLTTVLEKLFTKEPHLCARFLHLWLNAYSAAVTLSLIVFRAPSTPFASSAAVELEKVSQLFKRASMVLPASSQILPLVEKLSQKAHTCLKQHRSASHDPHASNPYPRVLAPGESSSLPTSFQNVHHTLLRFAEDVKSPSSRTLPPAPVSSHSPSAGQSTNGKVQESWLPDLYKYGPTEGLGTDMAARTLPIPLSTNGPQPLPTAQQLHADRQKLSVPSLPRIDGREEFNFESGALAVQLEDTSYMAWF